MSKYTMRRSINRAFSSQLVDNFILRQQEEQLEIYAKAQAVALEEDDHEEAERIEKKIAKLITSKIK